MVFLPLTLTLCANDGSASPETKTLTTAWNAETGEAADAFKREGYTIAGWNTKPDGSGTAYGAAPVVTEDKLTLYAQWEKILPSVEGGWSENGKLVATVTAPDGGTLIAAAYKDGRLVKVWTKSVAVGTAAVSIDTALTAAGGETFKLMLVDGNHAPLCAAWDSRRQ